MALAAGVALCATVWGQPTTISDGLTIPVAATGSPAGSYSLSGFETVNLYNGNLNVNVPILKVGGRGEAAYTISVPVTYLNTWTIFKGTDPGSGSYTYAPSQGYSQVAMDPYSPGIITVNTQFSGTLNCNQSQYPGINSTSTLTTLSFIRPDGTTTDLVDQQTGGAVLGDGGCVAQGPSRGNVFQSRDGSDLTFIADSTIYDSLIKPQSPTPAGPGTLIFKDGMRYRYLQNSAADAVLLAWIRDRNGNQITFNYDSNGFISEIADSLNRIITITRSQTAAQETDTIQYQGPGGTPETITINKPGSGSTPTTCLAPGYSQETMDQLFGTYNSGVGTAPNLCPVSSIALPNSQEYQFAYDSFGEVAQITLPTGGVIKYTWGAGPTNNPTDPDEGASVVLLDPYGQAYLYRRVLSRDVYPNGTTLEQHAVYAGTSTIVQGAYPTTVVTVDHYGADTLQLAHEKHSFYGAGGLKTSCGNTAWYPAWNDGKEYQTDEATTSSGSTLRSTAQAWANGYCAPGDTCLGTQLSTTFPACPMSADPSQGATNPFVSQVQTTLSDTGQVSLQTYQYDGYSNKTHMYEYDYGTGALLRHTYTTYVTGNGYDTITGTGASETHLPGLVSEQKVYNGSGTQVADTQYCYDQQTGANCLAATGLAGVSNPSGWTDPSNPQRGNVATIARLTSGSTYTQNSASYDLTGNVISTTDGNGNVTTYSYTDSFSTTDSSSNASNTLTNSALASWIFTPPCTSNCIANAFLTTITNPLSQEQTASYDYYIGKPTQVTDVANNVSTNYLFVDSSKNADPLGRLKSVGYPDGGSVAYTYSDSSNTITTTTALTAVADPCSATGQQESSSVVYDGLGRTVQAIKMEVVNGVSGQQAAVQTNFDGLGRAYQVSNPYTYPGSPSSWTTTAYDGLSRVVQVTDPDGSASYTGYAGNATTVVDEAGKWRQTTTDAAGRITQVVEDPAASVITATGTLTNAAVPPAISLLQYTTTYAYDAIDDLVGVSQSSQSRTFAYDAAKRLICAQNPESSAASTSCASLPASGVDRYTYDANGNLATHTDANGVTTSSYYDKLNRVIQKTYNDSVTPTAYYCYDGGTTGANCAGAPAAGAYSQRRLTWENNGNSSNSFAYDKMGRVSAHTQKTPNVPYSFQYKYNLGGELAWEQYPSGRQVTSCYDVAGRPTTVAGNLAGVNTNYSTQAWYGLDGQMTSASLNNGLLTETRAYSPDRLQLTSIQATTSSTSLGMGFTYGSSPHNNGNLQSQTITTSQVTHYQTYTYDAANRLAGVQETEPQLPNGVAAQALSMGFGYDAYGNQWTSSSSPAVGPATPTSPSQLNTANNRLAMSGEQYDTAGHLIQDAYLGTLKYYAGGQQYTVTNGGNVAAYYYDPAGRRVQKTLTGSTAGTVTYVYDAAGQLTAEYSTMAEADLGTQYLTQDHLGSTRLVTNSAGVALNQWDYFPFGGQIPNQYVYGNRDLSSISTTGETLKFTGKERDSETGLDYFGARYMSSAQGRWTSPDVVNVTDERLLNPGSTLNKYAYAANNPLKYIDPDGRDVTYFYDKGGIAGHSIVFAYNQATGDSAIEDFGPRIHAPIWLGHSMHETSEFQSADDIRANLTALTIQTTPEVAQEVINYIRANPDPALWTAVGPNCSTAAWKVLAAAKLAHQGFFQRRANQTPRRLWENLIHQYNPGQEKVTPQNGKDYGHPTYNMFDLLWLSLPQSEPKGTVTVTNCIKNPDGTTTCTTWK
jgi:RHS repeat-associated protein